MSWKKYFKAVGNEGGQLSPISGQTQRGPSYGSGGSGGQFGFKNYQSHLPEVYSGHPNRIERYNQYENMDNDSEINACLDIIAEFSTQTNESNDTPFEVSYTDTPTNNEIEIIRKQLQQWTKLNKFDQRMFRVFRNTLKYGDQVFVRDPETFELFWVDMTKVVKVIVNENEGKRPEQYVIRDINPNFQNLSITAKNTSDYGAGNAGEINGTGGGGAMGGGANYTIPNQPSTGSRFQQTMNETVIDAKNVVHLGLSEGLDFFWPFSQSVLEMIFKVFKQKELLEDSILIYRVQRAPERRVFYIDVGNMPSHLAMQFVERVKNEVHQRRIPSATGGQGQTSMDTTYNPLSINEDYFFPQTAEGRGSKVETLPGGENLGQIDDLKYFNNKMCRGLRVPSSYLPTGPDDSDRPMNDGRVGTALIQEYRFNQYCERLQKQVIEKLDDEFKMFLRWRGFNIDSGLFAIKFNPPQNFASYRQAELDTTRMQAFGALEPLAYFSKRFLMKRYLGLTDDELQENTEMWQEETGQPVDVEPTGSDLRTVGVSPSDIEGDVEMGDAVAADGEADPAMGGEPVDINDPLAAPEIPAPV
mgnify:FL=1|jgi:hypothetical protein